MSRGLFVFIETNIPPCINTATNTIRIGRIRQAFLKLFTNVVNSKKSAARNNT